jgi:hypothetical protein
MRARGLGVGLGVCSVAVVTAPPRCKLALQEST